VEGIIETRPAENKQEDVVTGDDDIPIVTESWKEDVEGLILVGT